jgi:hypothetical protein
VIINIPLLLDLSDQRTTTVTAKHQALERPVIYEISRMNPFLTKGTIHAKIPTFIGD